MDALQSLQVTWFVLWGALWTIYFVLDGFVLGTGMLHFVLGRDDAGRRTLLASVGPVWDGNEVWLITAGGATFAAFPTAYAIMFSSMYTALLLLLFALIMRGVSLEFRGKVESPAWRAAWDLSLAVSSLLVPLLLGVAFGNIFAGISMDATGFHGGLPALLTPWGLLSGALFIAMFAVHGALYVALKTTGAISGRAAVLAGRLWPVLLVLAVLFLAASTRTTRLWDNYRAAPYLLVVPLGAVAALLAVRVLLTRNALGTAFAASCATIALVVATGLVGLFPALIPSSTDPAWSVTIHNSSSSALTLGIMTGVVIVCLPVVIAYKAWAYRVFRAPVEGGGAGY